MSWHNIWNNSIYIHMHIEEKLANKEKSLVEESVVFTFPYQTNEDHATKLKQGAVC